MDDLYLDLENPADPGGVARAEPDDHSDRGILCAGVCVVCPLVAISVRRPGARLPLPSDDPGRSRAGHRRARRGDSGPRPGRLLLRPTHHGLLLREYRGRTTRRAAPVSSRSRLFVCHPIHRSIVLADPYIYICG